MASGTDDSGSNRYLRESLSDFGWRRGVFTVVIAIFFGIFLFVGFWRDLLFFFIGWSNTGVDLFAETFDAVEPHRFHIYIFSLLLWTAALGLLAQLRTPRQHIAAQWMALVPWIGFLIALLITDVLAPLPIIAIFGGLTVVATGLHPAGRDLVGSFSRSQINWVLVGLVVVATIPLLGYVSTQVGLQTGAIEPTHAEGVSWDHEVAHDEHVEEGHFAGVAAFAFTLIGVALLASLGPPGAWVPAWVAGVMAAGTGIVSLGFPDAASTVSPVWAGAAILWGIVFVAAAELTSTAEASVRDGDQQSKPVAHRREGDQS